MVPQVAPLPREAKRRRKRTPIIARQKMSGTLYIVATPIGNLEDITLRALRVLKEADLIACEDTRRTRKLLSHYQISRPTISYHRHNERQRSAELIKALEDGKIVALVSDAGTPLVSDPGFKLVEDATARSIPVVPVPGPSAILAALSASGLPSERFMFAGFLPSRRAARLSRLEELSQADATLILFEAPHRIQATLADMRTVLGERPCVIARELTKLHESFVRGALSEVQLGENATRGEIVLIVGQADQEQPAPPDRQSNPISEDLTRMIREEQLDQKAALKRVARQRGISRSEAYRRLLDERRSSKSE
jgi:16S rRNA (cytidine1402-2'-O)-methyltransferase